MDSFVARSDPSSIAAGGNRSAVSACRSGPRSPSVAAAAPSMQMDSALVDSSNSEPLVSDFALSIRKSRSSPVPGRECLAS